MNIVAVIAEIEAQVEGMPVRNAAALRSLRREYSKRTKALPAGEVVNIAAALIANPIRAASKSDSIQFFKELAFSVYESCTDTDLTSPFGLCSFHRALIPEKPEQPLALTDNRS